MSVKKQIADVFGRYITITCHSWLPLFDMIKPYQRVYKVKNIRLTTDYAKSPIGRFGYDKGTLFSTVFEQHIFRSLNTNKKVKTGNF